MSSPEDLLGAHVRLTAPDSRVFDFQVADFIPYAGEEYVVLTGMDDPDQILITKVQEGENGAEFLVMQEDDIIQQVMEKRLVKAVKASLSGCCEQDCDD